MSVVKKLMKFIFISTVLTLSLFLFTISLPIANAESFLVDVYDTDTSPRHVEEGEEAILSAKVELVDAPSGYHLVSIDWYVDDSLEHTATHSMRKGEVKSVTWSFDTSGFSIGSHEVKINATVDNVSDMDSNIFFVEEEIELKLDDLEVDPSTVCIDESETVELSVEVTLDKGPDDTEVVAKFYIKENGHWDFVEKEEKRMDEDEERTFKVEYDYDADSLEEERHEVKVVVKAGDEEEVEYASLDVEDCFLISDGIEVGWITISPEFPEIGDTILASVPISLQISRTLPEDVFVKAYVDGRLIDSITMRFSHLIKKTFTFTIDTRDYSRGTHTIEVVATVDRTADTSRRTFILGPEGIPEDIHCLNVGLETEYLKPGEDATIVAEVSNCGSTTEKYIKIRLEAFSRIYFSDIFSISPSRSQESKITVHIPEDAEDTYTFLASVWNSYTSDSTSKDFTVSTGQPLIEVKQEYRVETCKSNEVVFSILNIGKVTDTFNLNLEEPGWITGMPEEVTLDPDERKFITIYVTVPCDADEGYYRFTVMAQNKKEHSVISNLKVVKPWTWPTLPIGLFVVPAIAWLPWLLLIIVLIFFYLAYNRFILSRKRPMFE